MKKISRSSRLLGYALSLGLAASTVASVAEHGTVGIPAAFAAKKDKKKDKKKDEKKEEKKDEKKDAKKDEKDGKIDEEADASGKKSTAVKEEKKADKKDEKKEEKAEETAFRTTGPASIKLDEAGGKKIDFSAKADKKRDETIEEIKKLLPKVKGDQKGELVFRLAEAYWEKSKYLNLQEMEKFNADYEKWIDGGRQAKEPKATGYTKTSETYKKQALTNYKVVLDEFPEYPRLDEVLYIMAYNQYEAGNKKEAVDNYSKLIRQYQQSEYVSDSYLALGEHYFNGNDVSRAQKAYKKAYEEGKKDDRPGVHRYALYKLAWCDYNTQEFAEALNKFKQIIDESEKAEKKSAAAGKKDNIRLKQEAINDMVLTYAQLDTVQPAYDYFKSKTDNKEAWRLTSKLAGVYQENGKFDRHIETLQLLLKVDPDTADAPDFQSAIITSYSKANNRDAVRKEITRMVELYRPGTSWWRKNEANQTSVERARTLAENRMRELVTEYHSYAQKFKKVEDFMLARDIYKQYLQAFTDSESAYRLNYFYAEILWDLGEWEDAANEYDNVVKRDSKGEYTRNSAWNAVLAWEKIVKNEPKPEFKNGILQEGKKGRNEGSVKKEDIKTIEKIVENKEYKPEPIPKAELKLADACDRYVNAVPESVSKGDQALTDELIVVKFKAGYIYQSHYHFDDAAKRFGELIERWPTHEYARKGADLILDSYAARKQWPELEKWSRTFADNKPLMKDAKFVEAVSKYMEGASFKSIELLHEKAKDLDKSKKKDEARPLYAESAERFAKFVEEFPKSEFAPVALYNSSIIYQDAEQVDLAIAASNKLLKDYSARLTTDQVLVDNKVEETVLLNLAGSYSKVANYKAASDTYLKFVEKYKTSNKAPDALYDAGVFLLGLGDHKTAVATFNRYIKEYPAQKDIPAVYLQTAAVYEDQEDWKQASALYSGFEKTYGAKASNEQLVSSRYRAALANLKLGQEEAAVGICKGVVDAVKKLPEKDRQVASIQLAAGFCAFQALEPEWRAYKAIKIDAKSMPGIKSALESKKSKMADLFKRYREILNYGNGEWGIAGYARSANALLEYVNALRNAPDPPMLADNFDALDLFRTELENLVLPVEEQAIQDLETALKKAFELGIYSSFTMEIEDNLRKFQPSRFGRVYEMPFYSK